MRGISLPVMSQPHKFVASLAPTLEGRSTHTTTGLSEFGLIGSYVMIWWCGQQFNHRERDGDWNEPRERERESRREKLGSWRYAVWRHDMCNSFNYELCTEYLHAPSFYSLFIPLYTLLYHYPLSTTYPNHYRCTDRLSSYILICAPSSTLGLDRRKWKGLSNRGLISPSLLSIWKWASTRFISRLLTLAPYSRSSDTARGKKNTPPSTHPPPPPKEGKK